MTEANRNLLLRVLSAVVLVPPLLWAVFYHRPEPLAAVILLATLIAQAEFYRMALHDSPSWVRTVGLLLGLAIASALLWGHGSVPVSILLATTVIICAVVQLVICKDVATTASHTGLMVFGIFYVAVLLSCAAALKFLPQGGLWVLLLMSLVWLSDTGAYFVGRALGKHRLSPLISPGKSWEGAIGGVLGALVAVAVAKLCCLPQLSWVDVALLAIPGSILGQVGDLVESMFKRGFGVKDSGKILPGHGGLLDRIDGLLFAAPYVYLYASLIVLPRGT